MAVMPTPLLLPNDDFTRVPLQVHRVFQHIQQTPRLMDVWAVPLPGGGPGRTIADVEALLRNSSPADINPVVRGLFAIREGLGWLLGWDPDPASTPASLPESSFAHRLPDDLGAASTVAPGTQRGMVRVLYQLGDEVLLEAINATAHAFVSFSLRPQDNSPDYLGLLAVYVIETKWWTRLYLGLIEPFRRYLVYPSLLRTLQRHWAAKVG